MLDLKFIRSHMESIREMLQNRGHDLDISAFEAVDTRRREVLPGLEGLRHQRNRVGEEIAEMKKRREDASALIGEMKKVSAEIKERESALAAIDEELGPFLMIMPNIPDKSVPVGVDARDNPVVRTWGEIRKRDSEPLPHWEIGERLGILDFARASKIAGARFALYRGLGARLERSLINFMLDVHTKEHGYTEVLPPFMVNAASMTGTGRAPSTASAAMRAGIQFHHLLRHEIDRV